jgi:hypothetical protein
VVETGPLSSILRHGVLKAGTAGDTQPKPNASN